MKLKPNSGFFCGIIMLCLSCLQSHAQLPTILALAPDARSTGMADMGVATSPDNNSQYFNVAKYAFAGKAGIALSYSPMMRKLSPDMHTLYLAGYGHLGDNNYLSGAISYMSLGEMLLSDGTTIISHHPSEWAIDLGYSRQLTPNIALGIAFRYASAVYANWNMFSISSAGALAADAGAYFQYPVGQNQLSAGVSITNIGTQFNFGGDTRASLPMALRLGVNHRFNFAEEHSLSLGAEVNQPFVYGAENSFKQAVFGVGAEYILQQWLFFRGGYFYNNKNHGDRSRLSLGAGISYQGFGADFSYWLPTSSANNTLDNTVHITLSYLF
ncbi:MAG: PorV/PorQ family protein [Bacteroidales bacterium]|nr:PorV/PorQ family protein [Bacteroidales bacterium]